LDEAAGNNVYTDNGRGEFTGNVNDNGKFKDPSLRNIALTGPYMHDGRHATLDDVLDFYSDSVKEFGHRRCADVFEHLPARW
jgi:cytochrome c peroxidase